MSFILVGEKISLKDLLPGVPSMSKRCRHRLCPNWLNRRNTNLIQYWIISIFCCKRENWSCGCFEVTVGMIFGSLKCALRTWQNFRQIKQILNSISWGFVKAWNFLNLKQTSILLRWVSERLKLVLPQLNNKTTSILTYPN